MGTLHLLANPSAATTCLRTVTDADTVLLIGNGVLAATALVNKGVSCGALADDAERLGIEVPPSCRALSQADFVDWVVDHDTSVTWR